MFHLVSVLRTEVMNLNGVAVNYPARILIERATVTLSNESFQMLEVE